MAFSTYSVAVLTGMTLFTDGFLNILRSRLDGNDFVHLVQSISHDGDPCRNLFASPAHPEIEIHVELDAFHLVRPRRARMRVVSQRAEARGEGVAPAAGEGGYLLRGSLSRVGGHHRSDLRGAP